MQNLGLHNKVSCYQRHSPRANDLHRICALLSKSKYNLELVTMDTSLEVDLTALQISNFIFYSRCHIYATIKTTRLSVTVDVAGMAWSLHGKQT